MTKSLEELGAERDRHLKQAARIEKQLVEKVRSEFERGASLRNLAVRAKVAHPTIMRWLKR